MNAYEVVAAVAMVILAFCFMINLTVLGILISLRKEMREPNTETELATEIRVRDAGPERGSVRQPPARSHDAPPPAGD